MSVYSSPYDIKNSYSTLNSPVNGSVTASVVGHLVVLFLIIFGIPFVATNPEIIYEPIPVEIISSAELNKEKPPVEEAVEEPTPPPIKRQPPQMVEETPPEPTPEPVIEEVVPDPAPPPPPIETPESEVKEEVEPEKPIILPTRKPKPPPPKKIEKPKEEKPKQQNKLDNLLKNLADSDPAPQPVVQEQTAEPTPRAGISGGQLSYSEIDAVRAQISSCWNFPAGAKYAENLIVQIKLVMNTDRTVQRASVIDQSKYNRDPAFRAAADAALRAVRNPRCDPLNLPPAKYNEWKSITLNFDPRGML